MFCSKLIHIGAFLCLLLAIVLPLNAQLSQGGIVSGSVTAPDGGRLPQATISAPDILFFTHALSKDDEAEHK